MPPHSGSEPARIKLAAFDVDGTLLRGPTICERIAASIGRSDEMRAMERLTSIQDITAARAEMISWYQSYDRAQLLRFVRSVTFAPGAREGVAALKRAGVLVALVSITWRFAVEWVALELHANFAVGTQWDEDNTIAHFWPEDKAIWLAQCAANLGLTSAQVAAVGDSEGDMQMLTSAGVGYFVGRDLRDLPSHVQHWPAGDIMEIAQDILSVRNTAPGQAPRHT